MVIFNTRNRYTHNITPTNNVSSLEDKFKFGILNVTGLVGGTPSLDNIRFSPVSVQTLVVIVVEVVEQLVVEVVGEFVVEVVAELLVVEELVVGVVEELVEVVELLVVEFIYKN